MSFFRYYSSLTFSLSAKLFFRVFQTYQMRRLACRVALNLRYYSMFDFMTGTVAQNYCRTSGASRLLYNYAKRLYYLSFCEQWITYYILFFFFIRAAILFCFWATLMTLEKLASRMVLILPWFSMTRQSRDSMVLSTESISSNLLVIWLNRQTSTSSSCSCILTCRSWLTFLRLSKKVQSMLQVSEKNYLSTACMHFCTSSGLMVGVARDLAFLAFFIAGMLARQSSNYRVVLAGSVDLRKEFDIRFWVRSIRESSLISELVRQKDLILSNDIFKHYNQQQQARRHPARYPEMYVLIQYGVLTAISSYLVLRYAAPSVSPHVKFWSILTWVLNFALALLVPEDTYWSLNYSAESNPHRDTISAQYLILYWSVYVLTWTIIPVLQEWENSGDLTSGDRLRRSIKVNLVFYMWMLIGGVAVLVLLVVFNVGGEMGLITYLKCLATCWGILLQMVMMGYAIVEIPRTLWTQAHPEKNLNYYYKKIPEVAQEISDAVFEFKQICSYVLHTKNNMKDKPQIQQYCEVSMAQVPQQLKIEVPLKYDDYLSHLDYLQSYPLGLESSIQHHRLIKRVIARINRLKRTEQQLVDESILCQDIVQAKQNSRPLQSDIVQVTPFKSTWYLTLEPLLKKSAAIFLILFGIIITAAQTQVFLTNESSFLRWLLNVQNLQATRALVFIIIGLISYMVYYSLFRIKLSNIYGMYRGASDGPSIMFATINFSRVGVAIVLNFFDMVKLDSIYQHAMGTVNMGLLGEWIIKGIPGVLWLIILCHYYDVWGKMINKFKLSQDLKFNSHTVEGDGRLAQPYLVADRKKQLRKRKLQMGSAQEISLQQKLVS